MIGWATSQAALTLPLRVRTGGRQAWPHHRHICFRRRPMTRSARSAPPTASPHGIQQESAETLTLAARNATAVPGSTLDGVATIDRQTETNYDALTHDTVIIALFQPSACGPYIAINRAARPCSKPVPEPLARETPGADMPVMDAEGVADRRRRASRSAG
jgi:hypothetical protein